MVHATPANAVGTESAAGASGTRIVRTNNSIYYTTPSFNGITLNYGMKSKNDNASATTNTIGMQEIGISYTYKTFNLVAAQLEAKQGADADDVAIGANSKMKHQLVGANYTYGPVTVYAGYTTSKHSTQSTADSNSKNVAFRFQATPKIALMANIVKVDDKRPGVTAENRDLTGLGADYAFSKRTTAYVRHEQGDNDKNATTTGEFKRTAVGLRHTF